MTRTWARTLAIVNWKGVFYERYALDRHVTALEGANGAGKTTVMIAAYVVLLPDLGRLRFTNLGETAATGGDRGIWGRLGDPGKPSYAAMELALPGGARLVAGVLLERKTEPTLALTPFVIENLPESVGLKDVFLRAAGAEEEIPELGEVRQAVHLHGGALRVFPGPKDYFAALFDRGVLPLRLSTEEERTKMHDMLRTSMTGGISRALTAELRSFLLKEETALGDTIVRMRQNLDACRRTRGEVSEARTLEREITGVFEAGHAMFTAALLAVRTEVDEAEEACRLAHLDVERTTNEAHALERERGSAEERRRAHRGVVQETRAAIEALSRKRGQAVVAREIAQRLAKAESDVALAERAREEADRPRREAEELRARCVERRDRARAAHERAARGLGDLERGLEELRFRQSTHRHVVAELRRAEELLGAPVDTGSLAATAERSREELRALDLRRARAARDAAVRDIARAEHLRAKEALALVAAHLPLAIDDQDDHARARALLALAGAWEVRTARHAELAAARERLRAEAASAQGVADEARALGVARAASEAGVASVSRAIDACVDEARSAEREHDRLVRDRDAARSYAHEQRRRAEEAAREEPAWQELLVVARRLALPADQPLTRASILALRASHEARRDAIRAEMANAVDAQTRTAQEVKALEEAGGLPSALHALREALGAEFLTTRFEHLRADEARWMEAALGPLAQALVVRDPESSAEAMASLSTVPDTVWLIAEDDVDRVLSELSRTASASEAIDVVVAERHATRVSRLAAQPRLGREARRDRAKILRGEIDVLGENVERLRETLRAAEGSLRDADRLLGDALALDGGDPHARVERALREAAEADATAERLGPSIEELGHRRAALDERLAALRALAPRAQLLDADRTEGLEHVTRELEEITGFERALEATAGARAVLAESLDALRRDPAASVEDRQSASPEDRDRLFAALQALEAVLAHPEALAWTDLATPREDVAASGALREQHDRALAERETAEAELARVEALTEEHVRTARQAETRAAVAVAHLERARADLEAVGGAGPIEDPADLERRLAELEARREAAENDERTAATEAAVLTERASRHEHVVARARRDADAAEGRRGPVVATWQSLTRAADAADVLASALGRIERHPAEASGSSSEQRAAAQIKREILLDRLGKVAGGAEVTRSLEEAWSHGALGWLEAWLVTRSWAMRRLPAQFADVTDPAAALDKLRADLATLEERIGLHEHQLRGTSEDVARGIDVQLRKTAARVRRLNRDLETIGFGSVLAIRVQVKRVERMDLVLRALRGGEMQELLFQSNLPFEEALAEVFRRYGGGSRSGASKLLDYREYVELVVEIQRAATKEWETASPTRLSTGEAIGVGAALMMVVLTEWERDANVLRSDRATKTLRFLFLDEANRLSPDNLAVLFDLCRVLDLQLLVAAPEVARAKGNTTYRLVRRVDEAGREEVIVSGRRAVREADALPASESHGAPSHDDAGGSEAAPPAPPDERSDVSGELFS